MGVPPWTMSAPFTAHTVRSADIRQPRHLTHSILLVSTLYFPIISKMVLENSVPAFTLCTTMSTDGITKPAVGNTSYSQSPIAGYSTFVEHFYVSTSEYSRGRTVASAAVNSSNVFHVAFTWYNAIVCACKLSCETCSLS